MAYEVTVVLRVETVEDMPVAADIEYAFDCDVVEYDWEEV